MCVTADIANSSCAVVSPWCTSEREGFADHSRHKSFSLSFEPAKGGTPTDFQFFKFVLGIEPITTTYGTMYNGITDVETSIDNLYSMFVLTHMNKLEVTGD